MKYTAEEIAEAANLMPYTWVLQNEIKNEVGLLLEFDKRPWQVAMYNDLSPNQVELKPPQIGSTVKNTLKSLWVAKVLGRQIIYTLPTQGDVQDMVGGSFNRIIAQNPILQEWTNDHNTIEQKSVGDSIIFYRGTFTSKQAIMVSSGLNIHDEVDASDAEVITRYETRLQAQEDGGWRWYFSHPSLAGSGVDVYWQQSDKKEWFITCSSCQVSQTLTWPANLNIKTEKYICSHCQVALPEEDRLKGVWKNQAGIVWDGKIAGDYSFSGWHVSQLMLVHKSAKSIIEVFNDPLKDKQYFFNYVLGLPYIDSEDRIEEKIILRNCVDTINQQKGRTIIGVDTGLGLHITLMNTAGVFFYENATELTATKSPYDRLEYFLKRFSQSIVVIDQGGELMKTRQLQQKYPGRVFLCYYQKQHKSIEIVKWGTGDEYWKVVVDRNRMITLMVEQFRDVGRITLNGTAEEWGEFAAQFANMYRENLTTKQTKGKDQRELYGAEWVWKRNGPDHFCHSLLYALVGMQRFGQENAKIVGEHSLAGIPSGTINDPVAGFSPKQFSAENIVL